MRWLRFVAGHIVAHPRIHARGISNFLNVVGLPLIGALVLSSGYHLFLWDNVHARWSIIVALIAIAIAWLILRVQLTDTKNESIETFPASENHDNEEVEIDVPEAKTAKGENRILLATLIAEASTFSAHYGTAVIALLADMLAEPKTYVHRSSETVEVGRRITKRSVQLYMFVARHHLPNVGANYSRTATSAAGKRNRSAIRGRHRPETDPKILIPLVQQEKGRMYERMSIRSQTDGNVVALSYGGGSMAAYVAVLMHLYSTVFGLTEPYGEWNSTRQAQFAKIVGLIATSATGLINAGSRFASATPDYQGDKLSRSYRSFATARYAKRIEDILDTSTASNTSGIVESQRNKLLRIATIGITHYLIIVQCLPAEYMNFTYEYSQPTASLFCDQRRDEGIWLPRKLLSRLKLSNGYLRLSLASARHAKSYHMDISLQESGSYIQQAHFQIEKEGEEELTENQRKPVLVNPFHPLSVNNPYLRRPTNFRGSVHVYGRHLGRLFRDSSRRRAITQIEDIPTGES